MTLGISMGRATSLQDQNQSDIVISKSGSLYPVSIGFGKFRFLLSCYHHNQLLSSCCQLLSSRRQDPFSYNTRTNIFTLDLGFSLVRFF